MYDSPELKVLRICFGETILKEVRVPRAYGNFKGSVEDYFFDHSPGYSELALFPPVWTPEQHMIILDTVASFLYRECTLTIE